LAPAELLEEPRADGDQRVVAIRAGSERVDVGGVVDRDLRAADSGRLRLPLHRREQPALGRVARRLDDPRAGHPLRRPLRDRERDQRAREADDGGEDQQRLEVEGRSLLGEQRLDPEQLQHHREHDQHGDVRRDEERNPFHLHSLSTRRSPYLGTAAQVASEGRSPGEKLTAPTRLLRCPGIRLAPARVRSMPLETTPQIRFAAPRRAVVVLGAWFMRTVVRLPVRWQLCLGKALGTLARVALPGRRRVAARNIALCFPDLTEAERQRLVVEHFRALGASLVEMAMGWFGDERTIARLVRIEGREHLDAALARGRGVILFTAHFTAFELFSPVLATLCPRLCGMYKAQRNPAMNELMNRGRGRHFDVLFTKDNVREMLRALADNAVVWYAADQSYGRKGSALLPFLGEPAMTNTAISRIARVSGAAV